MSILYKSKIPHMRHLKSKRNQLRHAPMCPHIWLNMFVHETV